MNTYETAIKAIAALKFKDVPQKQGILIFIAEEKGCRKIMASKLTADSQLKFSAFLGETALGLAIQANEVARKADEKAGRK